MTLPPAPSSPPPTAVLRAWQQAILALDDLQTAHRVVQRSLQDWCRFYAHAIKDAPDPVFLRLLQRNILRARFALAANRLLPDLLSRLIPPREEPLAPGPLETLQLDDTAEPWFLQPQGSELVREVLRLLPGRQRQAFWLLYVERLPLQQAARVAARSRYGLRRDGARAVIMLTTILVLKGAVAESLPRAEVARQAMQALAGWQAELARQFATLPVLSVTRAQPLPGWRLLPLRYPLATRLCLLSLFGAVVLAGFWLDQRAHPNDPATMDVQMLASEVPLSVLLDQRFAEASND